MYRYEQVRSIYLSYVDVESSYEISCLCVHGSWWVFPSKTLTKLGNQRINNREMWGVNKIKQISTFMEVDVRISEEQYQDFIPSVPSNVLHKGRSWDRLKRHQQLLKLIDPSGRRGDCAETETLDQLWTAGIYGDLWMFIPVHPPKNGCWTQRTPLAGAILAMDHLLQHV